MATPFWTQGSIALPGAIILALNVQACTSGSPSTNAVTSSAWTVYSRESGEGRRSIEIPLGADQVYRTMRRTLEGLGDMRMSETDPASGTVTLAGKDARVTVQATDAGSQTTLLLIWADTGASGRPAGDLLEQTQQAICGDVNVRCNLRGR